MEYVDNDCFQIFQISFLLFSGYIVLLSIMFILYYMCSMYTSEKYIFPVHLLPFIHTYYMCSMYISGGGAYKYLFSSREAESWCAECAVRCVHVC